VPVNSTVGLLSLMDKGQTSLAGTDGWSRSAWVAYTIIVTVILVLQLLRWTQGFGHRDNLLPTTALLIIALAGLFQLKGLAKRLAQFVTWGILVIVIVMLIYR